MRKLGLFIVLAAVGLVLAAATVAAAPATSSASAANFRIHETIVAALIPSELVAERDGVPVETSVPHIGRATMLYGETLFSDHGEGSNGTVVTWIWSVGVSFATNTGDQLALGAVVTAHVPPDPMPAESEVGNRLGNVQGGIDARRRTVRHERPLAVRERRHRLRGNAPSASA